MVRQWILGVAAVLIACGVVGFAGVLFPEGATSLHFAFDGSPNGDYPVIRPPAGYVKADGFGFVDSPGLIGNARGVQAEKFFRFDADLPEGVYDVSVTVGSPLVDSVMTIKAEEHRVMVEDVHTNRGQSVNVGFTVWVHHDVAARNELNSDGRLNLEFVGQNPSMSKLTIRPNTGAVTVFIAGDSTVCDYDGVPRVGWGQMLPVFFKHVDGGGVVVCNCARSGRTAQSFIDEKRLEDVFKRMKAGDYFLIQFAHNDQKDPAMTAEKWKGVLMKYIEGTRERKATPVLVTSMPRRQFDGERKIKNSLGDFPETMRVLAKEQKVALIDLNASATAFFEKLGPEESKKAFCYYPANTFPGVTAAFADDTHFAAYGAFELARLVALGMKEAKLEVAGQVIEGLQPTNADPAKFPGNLGYGYMVKEKP